MTINIIRAKIVEAGMTQLEVIQRLNKNDGAPDPSLRTPANLSQKISRETLKYTEAERIAAVCGYKIVWLKQNENESADET